MDLQHFWQLVANSRLINSEQLPAVQAQFQTDALSAARQPHPKSAAQWLTDKKLISAFHAEVLLAGHPGPFVFGEYLIEQKYSSDLLPDSFLGVHRNSGHPVLLQFKPGKTDEHLEEWKEIEKLAQRARRADSAFLIPIFEPVDLPNHRMVVMGRPAGHPLSKKLPRKSRMPWEDACRVFGQVASGLHALHEAGIVHNAISPRMIWLHSGGLAQLRLAVFPDTDFDTPNLESQHAESRLDYTAPEAYTETTVEQPRLSRQSDLYALGCTLFRAVTGRVPFEEPDIPRKRQQHASSVIGDLSKYDFPESFEKLLQQLLAKKPDARPANAQVVSEILRQLVGSFDPKPVPGVSEELTPSLTRYRQNLRRWDPTAPARETNSSISVDVADEESKVAAATPASDRIQAARERAEKRKNNKWTMPAAILGGVVLVAGIVGIIAYFANQRPSLRFANQSNAADADADPAAIAGTDNANERTETRPVRFVQELVQDDRVTLWQSPTQRRELELQYLPSAAKIVFSLRPQAFLQTDEGPRILKAFGPRLNQQIAEWQNKIGLELADLERLTVTLHSNEDLQYDFFYQVELPELAENGNLLRIWQQPEAVELQSGPTIYQSPDGLAFFLIPSGTNGKSRSFLVGPRHLVEPVVSAKGVTAWSGTMRRLASWIDADQHVSFLFLRPSLFNDEGQWLMGSQLADFNEAFDQSLDENVRGGILSLHIEDGTYLEFTLDRDTSVKAGELKTRIDEQLRRGRDLLTKYFESAPSAEFWDNVRRKSPLMFANVYRNLRIGVEYGEVTGNCWLPPMAVHNLVATTELATSFSSGIPTAVVVNRPKTPNSLKELLEIPRDLSVTTSPDMNILLDGIRQEIIDDYSGLPFEFQIRLMGNDLSKEGITKNQRPNDFEMKQTSLADILTEIMVQCNPKKDIDGPSDPECKLIWVVADDPESPGNPAILVTTRAAAAANNYTLPKAFQETETP